MRRSIAALLKVPEPDRDPDWLEESLQSAVRLEFATIPLYLAALWSIKDPPAPPPPPQGSTWPPSVCLGAYAVLRGIAVEEMLHFALVCNMLTTIGRVPDVAGAVPSYPAVGLPGKVRPDLHVSLAGLTKPRVHDLFMQIEYPEYPVPGDPPPPPPPEGDYATIGALYDAIANAFQTIEPPITGDNQLTAATFDNYGCIGASKGGPETLPALQSMSDVQTAIETIKEQGEGKSAGPDAPDYNDELAHYFKFGSVYHGRLYVQGAGRKWDYTGERIPFPAVAHMHEVPRGGYRDPAPEVAKALLAFNDAFTSVVNGLNAAWTGGGNNALNDAITTMFGLAQLAAPLYEMTVPGTEKSYGPTFEYLASG
jgi:ferritin-like protein